MIDNGAKTGWLDGVRGVAALIVLFGHCSNAGIHIVPFLDLNAAAKLGVWIFFMLSAYLLTGKLIEQMGHGESKLRVLASYGIRRVLRIMPLYLAVLAALVLLGTFDPATALRNALLIEGWGHFWTIPVEMKFYAALPILVLLLLTVPPPRRALMAAVLLLLSLVAYIWLVDTPRIAENKIVLINYMPFFAMGIVLFTVSDRQVLTRRTAIAAAILCFLLAIALHPRSITYWINPSAVRSSDLYPLAAAAAAGVFFAATQSADVRRIFEWRIFRLFGTISFGAYLMHYFLIEPVVQWQWMPAVFKGSVVLLLTAIFATAGYLAIERPMVRLGVKITKGLRSAPAVHQGNPAH